MNLQNHDFQIFWDKYQASDIPDGLYHIELEQIDVETCSAGYKIVYLTGLILEGDYTGAYVQWQIYLNSRVGFLLLLRLIAIAAHELSTELDGEIVLQKLPDITRGRKMWVEKAPNRNRPDVSYYLMKDKP